MKEIIFVSLIIINILLIGYNIYSFISNHRHYKEVKKHFKLNIDDANFDLLKKKNAAEKEMTDEIEEKLQKVRAAAQ